MIQDALRDLHRSGRLIEVTFDTPREEPSVLESGVPSRRAPRTLGALSARDRKRRQRQRDKWRNEVWALTADQELVASVVDRGSYIRALEVNRRREQARLNDEVSYQIRLSGGWQSLGASGPRAIVECLRQDSSRGLGARKKTRLPARLQEGFHEDIIRIIDDQTSEMFSRILAQDLYTSSVGVGPYGGQDQSMTST